MMLLRHTLAAAVVASLLAEVGRGSAVPPTFDGGAAAAWVRRQCAFGPRVPGSTAHARCLADFGGYLDSLGVEWRPVSTTVTAPATGEPLTLVNVVVRFRPELTPRLLLAAHWDSRPIADRDPDPAKRTLPVLGANDGASGTAVLLALARHLDEAPPPIGVDLVLFDGEDLGRHDHPEEFCLGSQAMVKGWTGPWPDAVLVLDMVGAPGTVFGRELFADQEHPDWVRLPFEIAARKGYREWDVTAGTAIVDDHIPFLRAGVPASVLIGWGDPVWHTTHDRPERISRELLRRVGDVVVELVYGGYLGP